MTEAGGPAMAEMQPKPAGAVDRVKNKLREMFTPTGRAEVMAQKQIDSILAQVPEEKRVEAMKMLESRRPDLVAGKMEDAKGSLVRDAVIGTAVVGVAATGLGVAYWQRGRLAELGLKIYEKTPHKIIQGVEGVATKIVSAKQGTDKRTGDLKERVGIIFGSIRKRLSFSPKVVKAMDTPPVV